MIRNIKNLLKKKILAVFLMLSFVLSPVAAFAAADDLILQLDLLTATLVSVGAAISGSPAITDQERIDLLNQLILVSSQIVLLRDDIEDQRKAPPAPGQVTARDADLRRIILDVDVDTYRVEAKVIMNDNSSTTDTYRVSDRGFVDFFDKVDDIEDQMVMRLSNILGVSEEDIRDVSFVTAWNPIRDTSIDFFSGTPVTIEDSNGDQVAIGTTEALQIGLGIGQYSIIERVVVDPGNGGASIRLYSDQDEMVELFLRVHGFSEDAHRFEEIIYEEGPLYAVVNASTTFDYSSKVYFPIPTYDQLHPPLGCGDPGCADPTPPIRPKLQQLAEDIERDELDNYIAAISEPLPFTEQVDDFQNTALQYLLTNRAYYAYYDEDPVSPRSGVCIDEADEIVMVGFVESLLTTFEMQYDDDLLEENVGFVTPSVRKGAFGTNGCRAVTRYFD